MEKKKQKQKPNLHSRISELTGAQIFLQIK